MKKEKQVSREVELLKSNVNALYNLFMVKNPGWDMSKIDPLWLALKQEVTSQGDALIAASKIKPKPRSHKKLLEEVARSDRLTPELLEEIERSLKK